MKSILLLTAIASLVMLPTYAEASTIQYIGTGMKSRPIEVIYSRNNGATWARGRVKSGQVLNVPRDATHLIIDNVPRNPRQNYKIKDGIVFN